MIDMYFDQKDFLAIFVIIAVGGAAGYFLMDGGLTIQRGDASDNNVVRNSDFIYSESRLAGVQPPYFFSKFQSAPWSGTAAYNPELTPPRGDKKGMITMNAPDGERVRVFQTVNLPEKENLEAQAVVQNIAGKTDYSEYSGCTADSIIEIFASPGGDEGVRRDRVITPSSGWTTLTANLSAFSGQQVLLGVSVIAGGPRGDSCGEWGAIDQITVE